MIQRTAILAASLTAGLAVLAACSTSPAPAPPPENAAPPLAPLESVEVAEVRGPVTGQCGMENFRELIGRPGAEIDRRALPSGHRILAWDAIITMEYRAERLTIQLAEDGTVETVSCG